MLRLVLLAAILAGLTGCGSATPTTAPHKEEKKSGPGTSEKKPDTDKSHDAAPHGTKK